MIPAEYSGFRRPRCCCGACGPRLIQDRGGYRGEDAMEIVRAAVDSVYPYNLPKIGPASSSSRAGVASI